MKKRYVLLFVASLILCLSQAGLAQTKTHKVLVAVSSGDEADWRLAVGNIRNLIAGLKPDTTEIEVVGFGPGLKMVTGTSTVSEEIATLQGQGVHFVACQNAMRALHVEAKDLLPSVGQVPAGIVEVVTKQEQGWVYIKGGR